MTGVFIKRAKSGESAYITDVRNAYSALKSGERHTLRCVLNLIEKGTQRFFEINLPDLDQMDNEGVEFVKSYLCAEIYNILSGLGGRNMVIYLDESRDRLVTLVRGLDEAFGINRKRSERKGYGRCINVIDRMIDAICPSGDAAVGAGFRFIIRDVSEMPESGARSGTPEFDTGNIDSDGRISGMRTGRLAMAADGLEGKVICGMDIGGTSIKTVLVSDGSIFCFKEYDWFPAAFKVPQEMTDPVSMLVRLVRASLSVETDKTLSQARKRLLKEKIGQAMHRRAPFKTIEEAVNEAESISGENLILLDAIGISFPDVVVKDKIVGGEVYKTRGMRENPEIDYEKEFAKLTHLNDYLLRFCKPGGKVKISNDGNIAAFTAAVEMAAAQHGAPVSTGVFAHTIGTELGSGLVDGDGVIPEIPLECYNFIIDLGNFPGKGYDVDELRSINNFNTGLAGTLQKYTSQSGIFRLAVEQFPQKRPDLYREMLDRGFITEKTENGRKGLYVTLEPDDMRKALFKYLVELPERDGDETTKGIFKKIGEYLAVAWEETERILQPASKSRILFGGCVTDELCFALMKEGAGLRQSDIVLEVADDSMANTPLMKQLQASESFAVTQFAQAIGAVHYVNYWL